MAQIAIVAQHVVRSKSYTCPSHVHRGVTSMLRTRKLLPAADPAAPLTARQNALRLGTPLDPEVPALANKVCSGETPTPEELRMAQIAIVAQHVVRSKSYTCPSAVHRGVTSMLRTRKLLPAE